MFNLYLTTTTSGLQISKVGITKSNGREKLAESGDPSTWGRVLNFRLDTNDLREAQSVARRVERQLRKVRENDLMMERGCALIDGRKAFFATLGVLRKTGIWRPKNRTDPK